MAEPTVAENLMTVTETMPEGTAIADCGAASGCMGEVAAVKIVQALMASGEKRLPALVDKSRHSSLAETADRRKRTLRRSPP